MPDEDRIQKAQKWLNDDYCTMIGLPVQEWTEIYYGLVEMSRKAAALDELEQTLPAYKNEGATARRPGSWGHGFNAGINSCLTEIARLTEPLQKSKLERFEEWVNQGDLSRAAVIAKLQELKADPGE